jgi:serine/threonine protein kinase
MMLGQMFPTEPVPEKLGAYKVIRRLSGAGSADVYLGRMEGPMGFQRVCALKLVPNAIEGDARFAEELAREAAISARLNHPAIVRMFDFFEHERRLVLVLEHVDGADLDRLVQHLARRKQRLADNAVWYLAHQLAGALAHAHAATDEGGNATPVLHRNLNPENVLIAWDGQVRLGGFGLGKILGRTEDTVVGTVKGTPGFMAPEQARGERATTRADVYGFGVLLWSLLTGRMPPIDARPEPLSKLRDDLPREIVAAIEAAMEPSADRRKITCAEIEQWLAKVTKVESGRSELRDKILLLRSHRGETGGNETVRPARSPMQPRRRVSLRAVKAATGMPNSVPPPSNASLRPPRMSSAPPPRSVAPPARSVAPAARSAAPGARIDSVSPKRTPSMRVDPRVEPMDPVPPASPTDAPRAPQPTMLGGLEAPTPLPEMLPNAPVVIAVPPPEPSAESAEAAPRVASAVSVGPAAPSAALTPTPPVSAEPPAPVSYAIAPPMPPPITTSSAMGALGPQDPGPAWRDVREERAPAPLAFADPTRQVPMLAPPRRSNPLSPVQSILIVVVSAACVVSLGVWLVERDGDGASPEASAASAHATATAPAASSPNVAAAAKSVEPATHPAVAAIASTTASAAPPEPPSAAPTASAAAPPEPASAAPTAAPAPGLPGTPPAGYGYLTVTAPSKLGVFVNGKLAGSTNTPIPVVCGRFFIRMGQQPDGARFPTWHGQGMTVLIPCQGTLTVNVDGH